MRIFFSVLLFTCLLSCGSDTDPALEEAAAEQLTGRWELVEARRDNVKTGLLDGLYFDFGAGGRFETNLLTGEAQTGTFIRDAEEITTTDVAVPATYELVTLEGGVLILRSRIEGSVFDFALRRGGGAE